MVRTRARGPAVLTVVMLAFSVTTLTTILPAQSSSWQIVGQIGGPTQGVALQGHYAYVGVGLRLVVLDISNPAELREVGVTMPFPHFVEDVAVSGALAYVAAGGAGLRVVDVSNPALPSEIGAFDTRGYSEGVCLVGSTVFLADGPYGLRVIDVSRPSQPVEIGFAYSMNYAFGVAVQGRFAYVAGAGAGLLIADVSDPAHPVEVATLSTTGFAYGVAVAGDTAYVADGWDGVKAVSVTDPAHPLQFGTYRTPGWAFGITLSGAAAYVADAFGGLRVLDVKDPAHPTETASLDMPRGHAMSVAVSGSVVYVADRNWGVRAVSVAAGAAPAQLGTYHPLGFADSVATAGDRAYVAAGHYGFQVVDITDPTRPRQVGVVDFEGYARDVAVSGSHAYLASMGAGFAALHVIDVSDPAHPAAVGSCSLNPGQGRGLDVSGGIACVATELGLDLVDVSDPQHPSRVGYLPAQETGAEPETTVGVAIRGNLAYVAAEGGGLLVVDVSDPRNPVRVGRVSARGARDVAVVGGLAYVACNCCSLAIVDVSDPGQPAVMSSLSVPGSAEGMAVSGDLAYVADSDAGLLVVDVSDPHQPILIGALRTHGSSRQVLVSGQEVLLADGLDGLLIVEKAAGASEAFTSTSLVGDWEIDRRSDRTKRVPVPRMEAMACRTNGRAVGVGPTRAIAATNSCVVTSVADTGSGTLRWCLESGPDSATITFDPAVFPPSNPATIRIAAMLPGPRGNVAIDASEAGVVLDGSALTGWAPGLFLGTDGNTVRGLQIVNFPSAGVSITGSHNVVGGNRALGRGLSGQGNVLSGNLHGVEINGGFGSASDNVVIGNLIGTDVTGTHVCGNLRFGVFIPDGVGNRVGGDDPWDRNVISANGAAGVYVNGSGNRNLIAGNYVGTDVTGTFGLGNWVGISMDLGAFNNEVRGNVVGGSGADGVVISDWGSGYNAILGNRIGTDASGTSAIPNGQCGISVGFGGSAFNRIGGPRPEERNLVSGNLKGMCVQWGNTIIRGNFIGTDVTGRNAVGNAYSGVALGGGRSMFGGATAQEGNVIAASGLGAASDNYIAGNFFGTDPSGRVAMGSTAANVNLSGVHNVLQDNVIANARGAGVVTEPVGNTIRRNSIYSNADVGIGYSRGDIGGLTAPVILSVSSTGIAGTSCRGCEVEIFSDSDSEGRVFEGGTVADASGTFTFTKASGYLTGPNVTATATDTTGNTSQFCEPKPLPGWPVRRHVRRR